MEGLLKFMLVLASSGMILSWLNAWSDFLMSCMSAPSLSTMEMFLMLIFSVFITYIHKGKGWRIINILILHILCLLLAISWTTHMASNLSIPYWDIAWIYRFMESDRDFVGWIVVVFSEILVITLWIFGIRLAGDMDEDTISNRFDIGLAMFTLLLVIKLLVKTKGGMIAPTHNMEINILYFFLFGLFAVGLTHYQASNINASITYYKSTGIIISFTIVIFILGGLFSTLLLPGLTAGAEISYELIKTVSRPFLHAFVFIIRILFVSGCRRPIRTDEQRDGMNDEIPFDPSTINEEGLFMIIFRWSLFGIAAVILLFFIVLILYYIYKVLSSRTKKVETKDSLFDCLLYFLLQIKSFISNLLHKILYRSMKKTGSEIFYQLLRHWGTHSGLPPRLSETPNEYGSRLSHFFPSLKNEINDIIGIHNISLYGEKSVEPEQLRLTALAWRSLKSPRIWPARIKIWLSNPDFSDILEVNN